MNAENAAMTPAAENAVVETATESIGTRFTKKVLAQFASNTGSQIAVTEFQRRLIQGYFIQIDRALAVAEEARVAKNAKNRDHKWDETLPVTWKFVNLRTWQWTWYAMPAWAWICSARICCSRVRTRTTKRACTT